RLRFSGPKTSIICSPMTSLKTSIKTITYLSDTGCLEIQGASLGMTWDKKTLSLTILCASPYPSDSLLHHTAESMKNIVTLYSPINCEYHHTHAFYQIRVSQRGIVG
ncbi:hypothetical protein CWM24_27335, partial [Escherichia coli]